MTPHIAFNSKLAHPYHRTSSSDEGTESDDSSSNHNALTAARNLTADMQKIDSKAHETQTETVSSSDTDSDDSSSSDSENSDDSEASDSGSSSESNMGSGR